MAESIPVQPVLRVDRPSGKVESSREKVHHTVTACVRCRQRKTRCDPTLPKCEPCERSNARCEYYDSAKNRTISRNYITSLQDNVRRLQAELAALEMEREEPLTADSASMARGAGLIKFSENDESRFLGPSSGIAVTRFVMELAKQNTANKSIKEVVPDTTAQEIKDKFDQESSKPTSKIYPLISSVAAPHLPSHELMEGLISIYMVKAQYMLPLLHEPTFRADIQAVYQGSPDPTLNFQLRLVIAISMQKLDMQYAGLADSYYLAALPFLEPAVRKMDLSTLQCFALIAQYSLLTPTRTAAYWVVGLATRLCQDLGLCEEATIATSSSGVRYNTLEVDMRRRLFWIITSLEYGLSHSLGRPSAFGVSVDHIDVQFFEQCDDRFIAAEGLLPGHHPIMKKCIAIHFFRMRLLQAEIRRTLYLRKRDAPTSDQDPWFQQMSSKIDAWVANCPRNDEGSGLSPAWFQGRRNTMVVFMYRPSPQIPEPSLDAAMRCYDASVFNIELQLHQVQASLIDVTWIFAQALFMALNTVLWSLSYSEIREMHPLEEVKVHLSKALMAIDLCASRWPGVQSARQLYDNLIWACLKAYDSNKSFRVTTSDKASPASTREISSPPSQNFSPSPASTTQTSMAAAPSPQSYGSSVPQYASQGDQYGMPGYCPPQYHGDVAGSGFSLPNGFEEQQSPPQPGDFSSQPLPEYMTHAVTQPPSSFHPPQFKMPSYSNAIPNTNAELPAWNTMATAGPHQSTFAPYADTEMTDRPWLGSFGDEYSRYMQQPFLSAAHQRRSLSEQQQMELMASLEKSQLPDVSNLVSDATTFYTAYLP